MRHEACYAIVQSLFSGYGRGIVGRLGVVAGSRAMNAKRNKLESPVSWVAARGLWAVMLVAHAPALTSSFRKLLLHGFSAEGLAGFIVLLAAMAFFAVKLVDLPRFRFRLNRQSVLASILVIAVLHAGCLDSDFRFQLATDELLVLSAVTVGMAVHGVICRRRFLDAVAASVAARRLTLPGRPRGSIWLDQSRPHCWVLASNLLHLRAPPA